MSERKKREATTSPTRPQQTHTSTGGMDVHTVSSQSMGKVKLDPVETDVRIMSSSFASHVVYQPSVIQYQLPQEPESKRHHPDTGIDAAGSVQQSVYDEQMKRRLWMHEMRNARNE